MFNTAPDVRAKDKRISKRADALATRLIGLRGEYERYLYQAVGRKVDFEGVEIEKGGPCHYNVTAKYIVLKGNTEPMAPRFYISLSISQDTSSDLDSAIKTDVACLRSFSNMLHCCGVPQAPAKIDRAVGMLNA